MYALAQRQNRAQKSGASTLRTKETSALCHSDPALSLRRTLDHRVTQRIQQAQTKECELESTRPASPWYGHDFSRILLFPNAARAVQAKLAINEPGDKYEQEAERVAERVIRMSEPEIQPAGGCSAGCPKSQPEQSQHQDLPMTRIGASEPGGISAPPIVEEVVRAPGQQMDPGGSGRSVPLPRLAADGGDACARAADRSA